MLNVIVGEKNSYAGIQNRKADDMNQVEKVGKIKMKRLDDICRDLKTINLLKIDVEGYELPVLKGGVKNLKENKTNSFRNFGQSIKKILLFIK